MRGGYMKNGPILAAIAIAACNTVDSEDLRTSGMYLEASVLTQEDGTYFSAHISTGPSGGWADSVELTGDDRLTASYGGQTLVLYPESPTSTDYSGRVDEMDVGSEVQIALERSGDVDGETVVPMPPLFEITSPAVGELVPLNGAPLGISWEPADPGYQVSYTVEFGACSYDYLTGQTDDDGSVTLASVEIKAGVLPTTECDGQAVLVRTRVGQVDPAFEEGGDISGSQRRTVNFRFVVD